MYFCVNTGSWIPGKNDRDPGIRDPGIAVLQALHVWRRGGMLH
jgi:hypothetical protein